MDALSALLTRERLLLELLVFKLVELRQLLLAGEPRFLGWAAEEVERAAAAVRAAETERAVLVAAVANDRGLDPDTLTLTALVADAPEPWRTLLADIQQALRTSAAEVQELLAGTHRLAAAGDRSLTETLLRLSGDPEPEPELTTYGPGARWEISVPQPRVRRSL